MSTIPRALARESVRERLRESDIECVVAAARAGDPSAWDALVARFRVQVTRVARGHGLNAYDADDVVQETWLRLFRSLDRVRDVRALGAWLTTTARRESLRVIEGAKRELPSDEDLTPEATAPEELDRELLDAQRRDAVIRALDALPARHRELMQSLLAEPAASYAEISARLDIPIGSIGPIRGRCLARLRGDDRLRAAAASVD